jgi:uncharacterized protein YcgL (UPF0745 family)
MSSYDLALINGREIMHCFVYASQRQTATYVWLRERDDFGLLPRPLRDKLGPLRYVLDLDLTRERHLPHAHAATVMSELQARGWYLQLPPADTQPAASI